MPSTYDTYLRLAGRRGGRRAFSLAYMLKVPYFASVRPQVIDMSPHSATVRVGKRHRAQNHLGTLHALAVANGLEAAMGLLCEATVPIGMRWIPKGIQLDYLAKVPTAVRCEARTRPVDWASEPPFQVDVRCSAFTDDGTEVVRGTIPVWVTRQH